MIRNPRRGPEEWEQLKFHRVPRFLHLIFFFLPVYQLDPCKKDYIMFYRSGCKNDFPGKAHPPPVPHPPAYSAKSYPLGSASPATRPNPPKPAQTGPPGPGREDRKAEGGPEGLLSLRENQNVKCFLLYSFLYMTFPPLPRNVPKED